MDIYILDLRFASMKINCILRLKIVFPLKDPVKSVWLIYRKIRSWLIENYGQEALRIEVGRSCNVL